MNVYRASAECLEKSKAANSKEKTMEKSLNKWCRDNFINSRSLRHARDVHRSVLGFLVSELRFSVFTLGENLN